MQAKKWRHFTVVLKTDHLRGLDRYQVSCAPQEHNYILASSNILYYLLPLNRGIIKISSAPSLKYFASACMRLTFLAIYIENHRLCLFNTNSLLLPQQMLHTAKHDCHAAGGWKFKNNMVYTQDCRTWFRWTKRSSFNLCHSCLVFCHQWVTLICWK